jgi:hypothetical protein
MITMYFMPICQSNTPRFAGSVPSSGLFRVQHAGHIYGGCRVCGWAEILTTKTGGSQRGLWPQPKHISRKDAKNAKFFFAIFASWREKNKILIHSSTQVGAERVEPTERMGHAGDSLFSLSCLRVHDILVGFR